MKTKLAIAAALIVVAAASSLGTIQSAMAKKGTPFQASFDHGCNDTKVTFDARYINQPGKGPSFHTQEFMSGYNRGFNMCIDKPSSVASNVGSSSNNGTSSPVFKQGYENGVADAKLSTPTLGLSTDNVDCESPSNLSGQDSIQYCKGYEDGFVAENNALLHK
jgi:hypothetical protein